MVVGSWDNNVYALNGEDGSVLWSYTTGYLIYSSSPALGDVDGDGKLEVVIGSDDNKIYALNGEDGSLLWSYATGREVESSPALGDIDGDGKLEVVVGSNDSTVYALNGEDGSLLWPYTTGDWVESSPALGDIDGDGKLEVVVGSDDSSVYALNGEDGSVLWLYTTGDAVLSSPALGDIDRDGKLEVVVGSFDEMVYALNGEFITLIFPNGGESWAGGDTQTIKWTGEMTSIDHIMILFSADAGTTYTDTIADSIPYTDTSYNWVVPSINSVTCRIKTQLLDQSDNLVCDDESDTNFTIDSDPPPTVTLISPSESAYLNDSIVNFIWNKASDNLSGIDHYVLQYALDSSFTQGLVETTAVDTIFTGILSDTIYYWHVKAYDRAGNQGNFSNPDSFGIDMAAPIFDSTSIWTDTSYIGGFKIATKVTDNLSGVDSVLLYYKREEDADWIIKTMHASGDWFTDTIPAVSNLDDTVKYYIKATDNASNTSTDPAGAPSSYYSFVANYTGIQEKITKPHNFSFGIKNTVSIDKVIFNLVLPRADDITLCIYDITGRLIDMPINGRKQAGIYKIIWTSGKSSGVYFYKFNSLQGKKAGKFIFMK